MNKIEEIIDSCKCKKFNEETTKKTRSNEIEDFLIKDIANFLKIFSDQTRLRIACLLLEEEMCGCEIADLLKMSRSSISHHLRVLRQEKIVTSKREGKTIYYFLENIYIKTILRGGVEYFQY